MSEYESKCPECGEKDYLPPGVEALCPSCENTVYLKPIEEEAE